MTENQVSLTIAALYGGMIFLLFYTQLGGFATVMLALAILVVYMVLEAWLAYRNDRQQRRDLATAWRRWRAWRRERANR